MENKREEMNRRIRLLGIVIIALFFISFVWLIVKANYVYQVINESDLFYVIEVSAAPIEQEQISYDISKEPIIIISEIEPILDNVEVINPCFTGYNDVFEHGELISGVCVDCGEFIPRYGFTDDEIYLLAQLLCGDESIDGDGEYDFAKFPLYGMEVRDDQISLVLNVVMNRVRAEYRGNGTVTDVVLAKGQFAVMPRNLNTAPAAFALEKVREWCEAYDRWETWTQSIPENHLYFCAGPNLTNISRANWR